MKIDFSNYELVRIVRLELGDKLECQAQQSTVYSIQFQFFIWTVGNILIGWNTHIGGAAVLLLIPNIEFPKFEMN